MDSLLADFVRWIGTATALLALCATVPGATWGLIGSASDRVRRLFGRRSRSATVHATAAAVTMTSGSVRVRVTLGPDATVERRVEELERQVRQLDDDVDKLGSDLRDERRERVADVQRLTSHVDTQVAELREHLRAQQRESDKLNARMLPVAGFGILLSGIPGELACNVVVGLLACAAGLALCGVAIVQLVRSRPEPDAA